MKQGPELLKWAEAQAAVCTAKDAQLIGAHWEATTAAIAEAYLLGGIDALADEIARIKSDARSGAVPQADGSAT